MTIKKCAGCGKVLGERKTDCQGTSIENVSHGLCKDCLKKQWEQLRELFKSP